MAASLDFSDPDGLRRSMQGAGVLYNTYWIRFGRGRNTFDQAVANSRVLFEAAAKAGVGRIVHFSVANASTDSRLPYFRGKGHVEEILPLRHHPAHPGLRRRGPAAQQHGLGAAAVSGVPRLRERRLPGPGRLRGRLTAQAVDAGCRSENLVVDAAGPETFTFEELVRLLAKAVGARVRLVHTPPSLGFAMTRLVGLLLRDVVLTRDEVDGLMAGLLTSHGAPAGTARLAGWLEDNPGILGRQYVSELRRNFSRSP